jgi:pilus assembly protein CpaB
MPNPLRALMLALSRTPPAMTLLIIVGLAAVLTFVVTTEESRRKTDYEDKVATLERKATQKAKVVYVTRDIPEGSVIAADALEEKEIEATRTPQDAITSSPIAIGRVVKYGVNSGQILSSHDLAPQGITLGFESRLQEGQRAVTFAVDSNSGVAGFVNPDSHVDILGMVGTGADTKVAPILSDVHVIAVGQMYEKSRGQAAVPASSVTVAVTPDDTQKLVKAIAASKLYLALRNDKDHFPVATVDVTSLFPHAAKTETAMGSAQSTVAFELPPLPPPADPAQMLNSGASLNPNSAAASAPLPPPMHEIELWTGSKKDVISVPNH